MQPPMMYSKRGQLFTEGEESCRLVAYADVHNVPTIAYGHTKGVKLGDECTLVQADTWFLEDSAEAEHCVNSFVCCPLSQGEFDALVDFVINIGCGAFARSTLLRKLNAGDPQGAAAEFDNWKYVAGKLCQGLLRRRELETAEFKGAD